MGQAKLRGNQQQRIAAAEERKYANMGLKTVGMEEFYQVNDIPADCWVKGYIIHVAELNGFLSKASITTTHHHIACDMLFHHHYQYVSEPSTAIVFDKIDKALPLARMIGKEDATDICILFESEKQYQVVTAVTVSARLHVYDHAS